MQEAERLSRIEMNADYDARLAARRAAEQPFREPVVALAGVTVTVVALGVGIFFAGMLYGRWY